MKMKSVETKTLPHGQVGRSRRAWIPVLLLLITGLAAGAQTANQAKRIDYSTFRIITERNIFNPKRYARNIPQPRWPAAKVDAFTLVGTMTYEKGPFAFFEGTSPEYRKVAKLSDSIAGYKVTNIEFGSVKLTSPTNELQLPVGMQLRREEDGPWQVASTPEAAPTAPSTAIGSVSRPAETSSTLTGTTAQATTNQTAAASSPASSDEVLRRLMQRREQENNR